MGKAYLYWADLGGDDVARFDEAAAASSKWSTWVVPLVDDMQELYNFGARNTVESVFEIQHNPLWSSDWGWFEGGRQRHHSLCGIRGCVPTTLTTKQAGVSCRFRRPWNHFLEDDTYRRDVAIVSEDELAQDLEDGAPAATPSSTSRKTTPTTSPATGRRSIPTTRLTLGPTSTAETST